jgi:hypothetical protein
MMGTKLTPKVGLIKMKILNLQTKTIAVDLRLHPNSKLNNLLLSSLIELLQSRRGTGQVHQRRGSKHQVSNMV